MQRSASDPEAVEDNERARLLGNTSTAEPASTASEATTASPSEESRPVDGKPHGGGVVVIPVVSQATSSASDRAGEGQGSTPSIPTGHARSSSVDSTRSGGSSSAASSAGGTQKGEAGLCRICLEEDLLTNLEQPCACTGTQKYAHHECIQRWVNEKGHLRCEICDQQYRGNFSVPPQAAAGMEDGGNMFSPMFAIRVDPSGEALGGHHDRASLDFLDESDHYYQRNPLASWCFTFVIFIMFLVVLHHTMIVADGMDSSSGGSDSSSGSGSEDSDEYAASLTLFLFWIGTKAFLIGIPLYTVMRIAARQARREQYEAMLRSGAFDVPARRYVWRRQLRDHDRPAGRGHTAV